MLTGTFKFPDALFGRLTAPHVHGRPIGHPGVKRNGIDIGAADFPQSPRSATSSIPRPGG